jgi:Tfp pilus assembly protein PilX
MSDIRLIHNNEKGMVLPLGLMFLAIIAIMGTTAVVVTTTDLKIGSNYRASEQAFYAAEAGLEEARARLRGTSSILDNPDYAGDPATNPDATWSAYILTSSTWTTSDDPNYDSNYKNYIPTSTSHTATAPAANSLQSNISYWVKIRHKREADLLTGETYTDGGSTTNDILYRGYRTTSSTTLEEFTTSAANPDNALPIEIVRAYGSSPSGGSTKIIEVHVRRSIGPPIVGALYGNSVGGNGTVSVDGDDNCGQAGSVPAVTYCTTDNLSGSGNVALDSDAGETTQLASPLNVTQYVDALAPQATITWAAEPPNNHTVGSANNYEIIYCDTSVLESPADDKLDINNLTGYGTLVVKGDVSFSGLLNWFGLIICSGNADFTGGAGGKNIFGAVMANSTATMQGTVNIDYDSCEVDKARNDFSYSLARWRDVGLN